MTSVLASANRPDETTTEEMPNTRNQETIDSSSFRDFCVFRGWDLGHRTVKMREERRLSPPWNSHAGREFSQSFCSVEWCLSCKTAAGFCLNLRQQSVTCRASSPVRTMTRSVRMNCPDGTTTEERPKTRKSEKCDQSSFREFRGFRGC